MTTIPSRWTRARRGLAWVTATALASVALLYGFILREAGVSAARPAPGARYDALVVLGCRVDPSGQPSHSLWRRATLAADLYHAGVADRVITTGGVGDFGGSEASVAAAVLEAEGVPPDRILREERSTSTEENARYARAEFGDGRVLLVTDGFHTFRARRAFARFFREVDAVGTNAPWTRVRRMGALREVAALAGYAVLGRMSLDLDAGRNRREASVVPPPKTSAPRVLPRARTWAPFSLGGPFGAAGFLVSCGVDEARRFSQRGHRPRSAVRGA